MKTSEQISAFLDMLREARMDHNIAVQQESDADKETQDIMHWSEFEGGQASKDVKAAVLDAQSLVRQHRRRAKNTAEILKTVASWVDSNEQIVRSLERLLVEVCKAEKNTESRSYMEKTDIIARTLSTLDRRKEDECAGSGL